MNDKKNLITAIILSVTIIIGWEYYNLKKLPNDLQKKTMSGLGKQDSITGQASTSNTQINKNAAKEAKKTIISQKIKFSNNKVSGSFDSKGLVFNDLTLNNYQLEKNSPDNIRLLQDHNNKESYFLNLNWFVNNQILYNEDDVWEITAGSSITNDRSVTFKYSDYGILIERNIALNDNYLFTITDKITNISTQPILLNQYGFINKSMKELEQSLLILHEGAFGVFDGVLSELKYKKLLKKGQEKHQSMSGWLGLSDKYWFSAIIPDPAKSYDYRFSGYKKDSLNKFQTDFKSEQITLSSNENYVTKTLIFAGAKEIDIIDAIQKEHDIELFDRTIDFGILYFLTKPIYLLLKLLNNFLNNFGLAIIALTILIRILLFPLASKSFREISKIRNLHPEITKIRKSYSDDKMRINREIMSLYKKYNVKPMMGCFPVIIQVFIFFALYKVLYVTIDMRHAEFFGWINDLVAPDPTSIFNLFGLLPYEVNIKFGIWPCILGVTMVLQQKLNPAPADPMQAKMMKILPYFFTILFASFPAGLVLYWTFNNAFSIIQQYFIMKQTEQEIDGKK
jgi:YidC/Oxa1 family membrane protein insertase